MNGLLNIGRVESERPSIFALKKQRNGSDLRKLNAEFTSIIDNLWSAYSSQLARQVSITPQNNDRIDPECFRGISSEALELLMVLGRAATVDRSMLIVLQAVARMAKPSLIFKEIPACPSPNPATWEMHPGAQWFEHISTSALYIVPHPGPCRGSRTGRTGAG